MVADTDSESGAEAGDLEDEFSESEEEQGASAQEDKPQAATSGGKSPTWGLPHTTGCVDAVFQTFFCFWWNRQTYTTSNTWTD